MLKSYHELASDKVLLGLCEQIRKWMAMFDNTPPSAVRRREEDGQGREGFGALPTHGEAGEAAGGPLQKRKALRTLADVLAEASKSNPADLGIAELYALDKQLKEGSLPGRRRS